MPNNTLSVPNTTINRLLSQYQRDGFLKDEEGRILLGGLSRRATEHWEAGCKELTAAFIDLDRIRTCRLWEFSEHKSWTSFLQEWADNHGKSRSTAYYFLSAINLWRGGLNREPDELLEIEEGAYAIRPLLEGNSRMILETNDDGVPTRLEPGWQALLENKYGDSDPRTLVSKWVFDNIDRESTGRVVRSNMRQDQNSSKKSKPRVTYRPYIHDSRVIGFTWEFKDGNDDVTGDIVMFRKNTLPENIQRHFFGLLGVDLSTL